MLDAILLVEQRVVHEIMILAGDRDFPKDLTLRIAYEIRNSGILPRSLRERGLGNKGQQMSEILSKSMLIERLHDIFHDVANQKIQSRAGRLYDSPTKELAAIFDWEKDKKESTP